MSSGRTRCQRDGNILTPYFYKEQPDIWNIVLTAEDGKSLSLDEMHSNADLFMLAGTDTTGETSRVALVAFGPCTKLTARYQRRYCVA